MKCKLPNTCKLKKHFKKGLTPLLCALTVFNLVLFDVKASNIEISLPISEPYVSDTTSYVVAKTSWTSYVYIIDYYYAENHNGAQEADFYQGIGDSVWTSLRFTDNDGSGVPDTIYFDVSSRIHCFVSIYCYRADTGVFTRVFSRSLAPSTTYVYSENRSDDYEGFSFNGKFNNVQGNGLTNNFSVNWGNQLDLKPVIDYLKTIDTSLNNIELDIDSILSYVDDIRGDTEEIMKDTNDFMKKNELQLSEIIDILTDSNDDYGPINDVDSSSMNSVSSAESALINPSKDTALELVGDLSVLPISSMSGISLFLDATNSILSLNEDVYFMYFIILIFGVVSLIFNRK